jgi:AAA domain
LQRLPVGAQPPVPAVRVPAGSNGGSPSGELLELLLERIAAAGVDMRENGTDRWRGDCVACGGEDRLVVWQDLNGQVGIKCWGGTCGKGPVLEALGLPADALKRRREPARGRVTSATEVKAEKVRFLVPGRVPLGAVSLLAGDPKLGKSTLSCLYAAGVTLGRYGGDPAAVLIVSAEDSFTRIVKPRAVAVGADLELTKKFDVVDEDGPRYPNLPEDVHLLEAAVADHQVRLVVIDPLNAFLSGTVDSWKDHGVRRALAPLARMAEDQRCAVLVIVHLNKQRGGDPLYRIGGSIGQVGAARSVLSFGRDPDDPDEDRGSRRLLGHLASNWAELEPTQLYEIESVDVEVDDEWHRTSRLIYRGDTDQGAGDAFGTRARDDRGEDCEEAILDQLDDRKPHPSRTVKSAVMKELGVSARTVERAAIRLADRRELTIHERSSGGDKGGARRSTEWQLRGPVTLKGFKVATSPIPERVATLETPLESGKPGSEAKVATREGNVSPPCRDLDDGTLDEQVDGLLEDGP